MQKSALASQAMTYAIIALAVFMLGWGVLGMLEYLTGASPVMALQNPTFPPGTQFLHWVLITAFGAVFLIGYATRWHLTPFAVVVLFAMLATMCFIQTFDFMTNSYRFAAFALECVLYLAIATYLLRSERMRSWFGQV